MVELHIICSCGRNEKLSEHKAENLKWLEDEALQCECGKLIPFRGHQAIKKNGAAWVEREELKPVEIDEK